MKVRVKCTVFVEIEIRHDLDAQFYVEENGCPGTGAVGTAIKAAIEYGEKHSVCWACNLGGTNEIVPSLPVASPQKTQEDR